MKPTLETIAGLYAAAEQQREDAARAMRRVLESASRHGYTGQQISSAIDKERAARVKK